MYFTRILDIQAILQVGLPPISLVQSELSSLLKYRTNLLYDKLDKNTRYSNRQSPKYTTRGCGLWRAYFCFLWLLFNKRQKLYFKKFQQKS